jgi:hypothetical protein
MFKFNTEDLYPDIGVSLSTLLTMPVSIAGEERSFAKLRLSQTFLKSHVSGKLSSSSIQNTIIQNISFLKLLETLEDVKARKVNFHRYSSAFQDSSLI